MNKTQYYNKQVDKCMIRLRGETNKDKITMIQVDIQHSEECMLWYYRREMVRNLNNLNKKKGEI